MRFSVLSVELEGRAQCSYASSALVSVRFSCAQELDRDAAAHDKQPTLLPKTSALFN